MADMDFVVVVAEVAVVESSLKHSQTCYRLHLGFVWKTLVQSDDWCSQDGSQIQTLFTCFLDLEIVFYTSRSNLLYCILDEKFRVIEIKGTYH